ncbi:hypothetical protein [Gordonia bronchialis]|uniref:hypothetical protein n=1 Tax=Gordonia bronchialis TaxID=2054 RepID=UPI00242B8FEB|nr:hypothetical protein [Gordonia bronchialis]
MSPEIPEGPRALHDQELRELRVRQAQSAPHVIELNRLVWRIGKRERCEGRLPYLDPTYGGVDAEIIILLKAPQADANPVKGPDRLISLDNDDDPASTLFTLFQTLGLDRSRCVAWNICPFPIKQFDPNDQELVKGREDFKSFIGLLANPRVVLALGAKVRDGWIKHSFDDLVPGAQVIFAPSPAAPGIDRPGNRDRLRVALTQAFGQSTA